MRPLVTSWLLCLAAAATGCGADSGTPAGSAQEQVRATLAALAVADRSGDYGRYCELLSSASVRAVVQLGGGQECPAAVRSAGLGHAAANDAALEAAQITVTGDRAVAGIADGGQSVALVREGERWRVEILGPRAPAAAAAPPTSTPSAAAAPAGSVRADSEAKSDLRNAVSAIESCFTDGNTYVGCQPDVAPGGGPVELRSATVSTYEVVARSHSGNEYRIFRAPDGMLQRACVAPVATPSCPDGEW